MVTTRKSLLGNPSSFCCDDVIMEWAIICSLFVADLIYYVVTCTIKETEAAFHIAYVEGYGFDCANTYSMYPGI